MLQGVLTPPRPRSRHIPLCSRPPVSTQPPGDRTPRTLSALWPNDRLLRFEVVTLTLLVVLWMLVGFTVERLSFSVAAGQSVIVGVELASALARLFGALVLFLLPATTGRARLGWVGAGFLMLGLGQFGFGYAIPVLIGDFEWNRSLYAASAIWSVAGVCFVVGLIPVTPPQPSARLLVPLLLGATAAITLVSASSRHLPALVAGSASGLMTGVPSASTFTGWYWVMSLVPTGLMCAAAAASIVRCPGITPRGWLTAAMILLAGSELHNSFWPSIYSQTLTSASALRLAFSILVVAGGALELRRVAAEHEPALRAEREYAKRLSELAVLRADFTSMVAHEIGSPLAAIRAYADILEQDGLDPAMKGEATSTIRGQVDHLRNLVYDVATIASIESDQFDVRPFPLPLNLVLSDAAAFAASLPGDHPFRCTLRVHERVTVDPVRIAQVLRNLLSNAAKYSPPGTPIELRARRAGGRMRIEVADHGYGIPTEDLGLIFEKFGRSRAEPTRSVAGTGLGLYISRRIVEAHGALLTVTSTPGVGSVFSFEIEVAE